MALAAARWVADEDDAGRRDGLQATGRVDEVAGDHPLVRRPDGDRRLARQHARSRLDPRSQRPDRVDELEGGPDRAFRVVFVSRRCAPDRHHRIADELLDRAAISPDHVTRQVEIARQQVTGVLRVAALRQCREPDQVGEQDRDETTFGDRRRGGRLRLVRGGADRWSVTGRMPSHGGQRGRARVMHG